MGAPEYGREHARTDGVKISLHAMPRRLIVSDGHVPGIEFEYPADVEGKLSGTGETFELEADIVFKAIGQQFVPGIFNGSGDAIALEAGRIKVDDERRTSLPGVWAGGDCIAGGEDLTVAAGAGRHGPA